MAKTTVVTNAHQPEDPTSDLVLEPGVTNAADMWRIARDSGTLDLNSLYAYLIFCRDFGATCRVATVDGAVAGYITAYVPPARDGVLFVWQVAVDETFRGRGLAGRMLDELVHSLAASRGIRTVETTITDDNAASQRLFRSFAERWNDASVVKEPLFTEEHFGDSHDTEYLYTITHSA